VKIARQRKPGRESKKGLDASFEKRGRGRPQTIQRGWVIGRADNDRLKLTQVWARLGGPLLAAAEESQVQAAFEEHGQPYAADFVPRATSDIFELIRDSSFPKRPKAQIGFLADSLAGRPTVTARTSRDICSRERARLRGMSPHKIIRHEYYVECECGYKGPARDNACRECGASIPIDSNGILWGSARRF
jgi:hypothetical protein